MKKLIIIILLALISSVSYTQVLNKLFGPQNIGYGSPIDSNVSIQQNITKIFKPLYLPSTNPVRFLFTGASGVLRDNSNFSIDTTNAYFQIGGGTPLRPLHIFGNATRDAMIRITPQANGVPVGIEWTTTSSSTIVASFLMNASSGEFRWTSAAGGNFNSIYANGVEAMRFNTSQQVLIGRTSAIGSEKLSVGGRVNIGTMDSVGAQTGGCVFRDFATGLLEIGPCGGGSGGSNLIINNGGSAVNDSTITPFNSPFNQSNKWSGVGLYGLNMDSLTTLNVTASTGFGQSNPAKSAYYTSFVSPSGGHLFEFGFNNAIGIGSKGTGIIVDSNNNVAIGSLYSTSVPLYATGGSLMASGFNSFQGNFYFVQAITTNSTLTNQNYTVNVDATSGNVTITLPSAASMFGGTVGIVYHIKRIDTSGNTVTVQRTGSDTIDGATSFTLTSMQSKTVQSAGGTAWYIY